MEQVIVGGVLNLFWLIYCINLSSTVFISLHLMIIELPDVKLHIVPATSGLTSLSSSYFLIQFRKLITYHPVHDVNCYSSMAIIC